MEGNLGFVLFGVVVILLFIVRPVVGLIRDRRAHLAGNAAADRSEALFQAMFPELQPYFHPERVAEYVVSRVEKGAVPTGGILERPQGFPEAARARIEIAPKGERTILEDAAGAKLAEFTFERRQDALGSLRVGQGKLTVRRKLHRTPSVKYWHPEREFEWRSRGDWTFKTPVADRAIESSDSGTGWSRDSSSSSSSTAATAAAVAGLGGTFDGGGASAGWDGATAPGEGSGAPSATAAGDSDSGSDSGGDSGGESGGDSGSDSGGDSGSTSY